MEEVRKARALIEKGHKHTLKVDGSPDFVSRVEEALELKLDRHKKHEIEVVIDRLIIEKGLDRIRLVDSLETSLKLGKGTVIVSKSSTEKTAKKRLNR